MKHINFDCVIVGAGVAGALVASRLISAGKSVLVLEAGPNEQDREILRTRFFADESKNPSSPYSINDKAPHPNGENDYYEQTGPRPFASGYERRVGGTTWHWHALTPRMVPADFNMKTIYDRGVDWPISYDELETWYTDAEEELGVGGDSQDDHGSPRSKGFPYEVLRQSSVDVAVSGALSGKKYENHLLEVKSNRSARSPNICRGSGSCMPLCPTGAKYEAVRHINDAEDQGAIISAQSVATSIEVDIDGKVKQINYKSWDGSEHIAIGSTYVLAANAMEIPRLLLLSEQFGHGRIANSSDQVGRNLMDHPVQLSFIVTKQKLDFYKGPQSTSAISSHRNTPERAARGGFFIEIFNSGHGIFSGPDFAVNQLVEEGMRGDALANAIQSRMGHELTLVGEVEQLPDSNNRITLSKDKRDGLGLPTPSIHFDIDQYSLDGVEAIKAVADKVARGLDAQSVFHVPPLFGAGHIMGTTCMGNSASNSVVDVNLRCHDHKNLFIVSSSVFPTGTTANPTLTIAALALRLASHLNKII